MTVPLPVIAANRTQLASLVATNILGQNTSAIATTEAQYGEMWAQDAAAMYGYAANSAAATAKVTPFIAAPQTTNPAGLAAQSAQAASTSTGTGAQSTLSQLMSTIQTALQSLVSPNSSTSSTSGLSGILSGLLGGGSSTGSTTTTTGLGGILTSTSSGFSLGSILNSVIAEYAAIPAWAGISGGSVAFGTVFGPLMGSALNLGFTPAVTAAQQAAAAGAAGAAGRARRGRRPPRVRWGQGSLEVWADWRAWVKRPQSGRWRCRRAGAGPRHLRRCSVASRWRRRCRASIRAQWVGYQWQQPAYHS